MMDKTLADTIISLGTMITFGCCWFRAMKYLDARHAGRGSLFTSSKVKNEV